MGNLLGTQDTRSTQQKSRYALSDRNKLPEGRAVAVTSTATGTGTGGTASQYCIRVRAAVRKGVRKGEGSDRLTHRQVWGWLCPEFPFGNRPSRPAPAQQCNGLSNAVGMWHTAARCVERARLWSSIWCACIDES